MFVTKPGPFTDLAVAAIEEVTGRKPELEHHRRHLGRALHPSYCPVIEFGLVGQTMHQIDERTPVADLEQLTKIYRGVLERYFGEHARPSTVMAGLVPAMTENRAALNTPPAPDRALRRRDRAAGGAVAGG